MDVARAMRAHLSSDQRERERERESKKRDLRKMEFGEIVKGENGGNIAHGTACKVEI